MKIDDQEFRSFIANINIYLNNSTKNYIYSKQSVEEFSLIQNKIDNQIGKYLEMLEAPKPSKWKQLKIDL